MTIGVESIIMIFLRFLKSGGVRQKNDEKQREGCDYGNAKDV